MVGEQTGHDAPRHARRSRRSRRVGPWLAVALVLAILAGVAASYRFDLGPQWFGGDADGSPAAVPPPPGLSLPPVPTPNPVAAPATGGPDPAKVRRAIAPLLRNPDLGKDVLATVSALDGRLLYSRGIGQATPASTMKLLTTTAALETLGPEHTFRTTVVSDGPGRVVLVGGGDPLLARGPGERPAYPRRADVVTLARKAAHALRADGRTRVRVGYDTSLFSGPEVNPHWPATYIPEGVIAPIGPLWVDEGAPASGAGRVTDPAAVAADAFTAALTAAGITVVGAPRPVTAGAGDRVLASVSSPPLYQIVEETLENSDNEAAEVLAHQVGVAVSGDGSFAGGVRAVRQVLGRLGVPLDHARIYDGSGLSRDDRLDPDTLTAVLRLAASPQHPELRSVITGLPVAAFSGSLDDRFDQGADRWGRGIVHAKTGTLTGVSALAGTATDREGQPMVFALVADRIAATDTLDARAALDAVASALAGCRCSG